MRVRLCGQHEGAHAGSFNPRTHESATLELFPAMARVQGFNPRTHESATNAKSEALGVNLAGFQSTHS